MQSPEFGSLTFIFAVLGSSVIAALINVLWNFVSKLIDEKKKEKRLLESINHEMLIAISWADDVCVQLSDCASRLVDFLNDPNRSEDSYPRDPFPEIALPSSIEAKLLPIEFRSKLILIESNFNNCKDYIESAWLTWADASDCVELDIQRITFYGFEISMLSDSYRGNIHTKSNAYKEAVELISYNLNNYKILQETESANLIPELRAKNGD